MSKEEDTFSHIASASPESGKFSTQHDNSEWAKEFNKSSQEFAGLQLDMSLSKVDAKADGSYHFVVDTKGNEIDATKNSKGLGAFVIDATPNAPEPGKEGELPTFNFHVYMPRLMGGSEWEVKAGWGADGSSQIRDTKRRGEPEDKSTGIMGGAKAAARKGMTLVETVVVTAVIGVLLALLLPAVQSARNSARRTQTKNEGRQIAIAAHNHHDAHRIIPAAIANDPATGQPVSWQVRLMPFIEQQNAYEAYDFNQNPENQSAETMANNGFAIHNKPHPIAGRSLGRSDFMAIAGSGLPRGDAGTINASGHFDPPNRLADGVMAPGPWIGPNHQGIGTQSILDGTSNTAMLVEATHKTEPPYLDKNWAAPAYDGEYMDSAIGVNPINTDPKDRGHMTVYVTMGAVGTGRAPDKNRVVEHARGGSAHGNMTHIIMADGSVQTIRDQGYMDTGSANEIMQLWANRADGKVVPTPGQ